MPGRATIQDVADRAGVSRAAVSKVLRDAYGVSDAMRGRVDAAIKALAYRPQVAARGLRGSTDTLGIVLPDIRNPFFPGVLDGVMRRLAGTRFQTLLGVRPAENATERAVVDTMLDRNLDGLILIAPLLDQAALARIALAVPLVVLGDHARGGGYDTVNGDDALGARKVVEHLAGLGHRRIAYCGLTSGSAGPGNSVTIRQHGYEAAMRACGLGAHIEILAMGDAYAREVEVEAVAALLRREPRPTALFAWFDGAALNAFKAAQAVGLRVPEDLAIVGYDDSPIAAHPMVALSSVNQSGEGLGELAADALLSRRAGRRDERHDLIEPKLVVRRSSGA